MEARVVVGVILLVTLSLTGVLLAAWRVTTRSAVQRASANLEDARSAFYRLVDNLADVAAAKTRLIIALPLFRSVMINPVIAGDLATLTETADSYRQDLGAAFCVLTDPEGRPTATPGWTGERAFPPGLSAAIKGAGGGESRRDIVPIRGRLFLVTSEPAKFAETEVLGTITFGFALDDRVTQRLAEVTHSSQPHLGQPAGGQQPAACRTSRGGRGVDERCLLNPRAFRRRSVGWAAADSSKERSRCFPVVHPMQSVIWCCCRIGRPRSSSSTS
jgi:hypothetical protein